MYDRKQAVAYAKKWAYGRNPRYYNFDAIGGDCTNFVSQCLFAGWGEMNHTPETGWYYHSLHRRSAAWSGVEFLHRFLILNQGPGPKGEERPLEEAEEGDVIQLCHGDGDWYHTLVVTSVGKRPAPHNILIAAHTIDSRDRALSSYFYGDARLIHILG